MFRIRKSYVRIIAIAALVLVLSGVAISAVGAAGGVTIETSPMTQALLKVDDIEVGLFPLYDGAKYIHVSWSPYAFPAGVNGAYRISLFQDHNPLGDPDWVEISIRHHHADNPAGTEYDFGPFTEADHLCDWCPSVVVVQPETFVLNDEGGASPYQYTLLNVNYSTSAVANLEQSDEILISGIAEAVKEPSACSAAEVCTDGVDNDCDVAVDCNDSDCFTDPSCNL
jgi:hypothetical protein